MNRLAGLAAVLALAGYVVLAASESQRQVRLLAYRAQLEIWHTRQMLAVREYLNGRTDDLDLTEPPRWAG